MFWFVGDEGTPFVLCCVLSSASHAKVYRCYVCVLSKVHRCFILSVTKVHRLFCLCAFVCASCEAAGESILIATPVETTFATTSSGGGGTVTHYILSIVPRDEIFEPVNEMARLIRDSTTWVCGGRERGRSLPRSQPPRQAEFGRVDWAVFSNGIVLAGVLSWQQMVYFD